MTSSPFLVPSSFSNFDSASAELTLVSFLSKHVQASGAGGVVLGLSGGIDSALSALLCVKALGAKNVHPIFFYNADSGDSSGDSDYESTDLSDAQFLCDRLGLTLQKINLNSVFLAARSSFSFSDGGFDFSGSPDSSDSSDLILSSGNLISRLRMSLLYYYANRNNFLVVGTKNKTERLIGYFTKYGDGAVDLDPLADLYKTEVRLLSRFLNLPERFLLKTPSAGFWDEQSDEIDIGLRYDQLDALLYEIEKNKINPFDENDSHSPIADDILKETHLTKEQYAFVLSKMKSAEHKQKMPPFPIV